MARRYVRDNRGRFASVGATTRGGRLRTAAGNKRAAVTMQGPKRAGTVAKPRGLKPGAVAARRAAAQRAAKKAGKATEKQRNLREFMTQNRGAVARDYRSDAQAFRTRLPKKEQTAGGAKTVGGALEALASKSYQRNASRQGLFASEAARAQRLIGDNGIKGYKMQRTPYGSIVVRNGSVSAKAARLAEAAVTRGLARKGRNSRSRRAG